MFNVNSNKILAYRKLGTRLFIESTENHTVFFCMESGNLNWFCVWEHFAISRSI